MKDKAKVILVDLTLFLVVLFLLLLIHAVFIAGPIRVMEHEDNLYVEAFEKQERTSNLELQNRFTLSKTYYVVKKDKELIYFDQDLKEQGVHAYVPLSDAFEKAASLGFKEKHVSYGVFNHEIVFNLEKKNHIIFLDLDDLDVLFEFGG